MAKKKRKGVYARDVDQMNVWFAAVSIASFLSVAWMIWDDYAKPWKAYQRQFRVVQNEVTQQQLATEQAGIDQQRLAALRQQRDDAEQALSQQLEQVAQLEQELSRVQTRLDLADQNLRFARSTFDAVRWEFEEARKEARDHLGDGADEATVAAEVADKQAELDELSAEVDEVAAEVEVLTSSRDDLQGRLDALTDARDTAGSEIVGMNREIDRLQGRLDQLRFDWVYRLRNAPFMDGFNPSLRINQVVLDNIRFDLNFTDAPRVDRCESCHLGAGSADFESYAQPFTSHPRLDLFVSDSSPHPAGEFGCSVCHGGKGHATSFFTAVHTPDNESEQARWEHEYGWEPVHLWEWPMLPSDEIESGCLKCHASDTWLPESPDVEYGVELVESLGCYGCHQLDRFDDARKPGPDLSHVTSKTVPEWTFNWVMDPKSFRPDTPMPRFFGLANTSDAYWTERNVVEADSIVAYLFDNSTPVALDSAPAGDVARGQALVESVGCLGCHTVGEEAVAEDADAGTARFSGYRHQGPNLAGLGSKVNADWLYTWVRNPTHYWADTVMPDLRLTDREAADVTAYLMSMQREGWDSTIPPVNAALRDEVALEYLRQQMPTVQARERLDGMSDEDKRQYLGGRLIARYGCSGCHLIPGFEEAGRIGTSLSDWGSKAVARLDFGLLELEHERRAFLEQKLRAPRSYDDGRVRRPQELLKMPNYDLDDHEIDAIATAILGFTDEEMLPEALPPDTAMRRTIEAGRQIADTYNCRGCHVLEDRGGAIRDVIADAKVASGEVTSRAAGLVFGPPNLRSQGARVQPAWLYGFFKEPSTVRPWLDVRMPTFAFDDTQLNALTAYFATLDDVPYPFEETFTASHSYPANLIREGRQLAADQRGSLQCLSCHFQGDQQPRVQPSQWAPDLALAADRLRPNWIDTWIKDPQSLQPGTNMPQFYASLDPGDGYWEALNRDPNAEIQAMVAYIMSIGR